MCASLATVPSAPPVDVNGSVLSSTSLRISWSPPPDQDRNGVILGYVVTYFSIPDGTEMSSSTTEMFIELHGLDKFTNYSVSVAARTSVGTGPPASVIVMTDSDSELTLASVVSKCCYALVLFPCLCSSRTSTQFASSCA